MTLVKLNRPAERTFNRFFEDFFNDFTTTPAHNFASNNYKHGAPANIKETATSYVLELQVPGFEKNDLKIDVENGTLTVSAEKKEEVLNETEKQIRKEFKLSSFKRSFTLNDKINADAIEAKYENGILRLNLPRKEEVKPSAKQIAIN
jgi:HSP20 family protein